MKVSFLKKLIPMRIVSLRVKRFPAPKIMHPAKDLPPMEELLKKYDHLRSQTKEMCVQAGQERLSRICFQASVLW